MNISNLSVARRLALAFGLILALTTILLAVAVTKIGSIGEIASRLVKEDFLKASVSASLTARTQANARYTLELLLIQDKNQRDKIRAKIEENRKLNGESVVVLDKLLVRPEAREMLARIKELRSAYVGSFTRGAELIEEGKPEQARELILKQTMPALDELQAQFAKLEKFQANLVSEKGEIAIGTVTSAKIFILALGAGVLLAGVAFSILLARSITRPLNRAVAIAQTVAAGDLTSDIEVTSQDETGKLLQALKDMNESLVSIVGNVRQGTETIATASGQIASGNFDLSSRTEQQASSLEETAASMEELTSTVKQNADNARQANQLSLSAAEIAARGGEVVSKVVTTMDGINESSKKVSEIISVIDGIAFQTNILALNAAVEAARAGEQGRGFAVVATEVRSLAQRSAAAAREIKVLIDDSVAKVADGTKLVDEAGVTINKVVSSVKRVNDIMGEITAASQEQSQGIEQVNQAIAQMDEVTQQNAALVEEAAAAAGSLQEQADTLSKLVGTFKLGTGSVGLVSLQPTMTPAAAGRLAASSAQPRIAAKPSSSRAVAHPRSSAQARSPQVAEAGQWEEF